METQTSEMKEMVWQGDSSEAKAERKTSAKLSHFKLGDDNVSFSQLFYTRILKMGQGGDNQAPAWVAIPWKTGITC